MHLNTQIYKNAKYTNFTWGNPKQDQLRGSAVLMGLITGKFGHNQAGKIFRRAKYLQAIDNITWPYLEENRIVVGEDFLFTMAASAVSSYYVGIQKQFYIYN